MELKDKLWCVSTNIVGKVLDPGNKSDVRLIESL